MFAVIFEVCPRHGQWDAYLGHAGMLRPELERIDGFLDNVRYRSLTRPGWLLSLSTWRDEKALIRWRTDALHHQSQLQARWTIFDDYHLRVGEIIGDGNMPVQRLDVTQTGAGKAVSLTRVCRPDTFTDDVSPEDQARHLALDHAPGLVAWDVFEAILTPGDLLLLRTWRDAVPQADLPGSAAVRIIRDYGMFDRREAPQYYPEVPRSG